MADHSARIAALEEALGSGELTIKVEGKETTYRNAGEIITAIRFLEGRSSSGAATTSPAFGSTLATFGAD